MYVCTNVTTKQSAKKLKFDNFIRRYKQIK